MGIALDVTMSCALMAVQESVCGAGGARARGWCIVCMCVCVCECVHVRMCARVWVWQITAYALIDQQSVGGTDVGGEEGGGMRNVRVRVAAVSVTRCVY